jgi:outer membrane protein assembly factor BamB
VNARTGVRCAALIGVMLLTSCSPAPHSHVRSATAAAATATPAPTAAPRPTTPGFLLPGEAAALPSLPAGVPFTGHLLIAESSGHSRILEINPTGIVTWSLATTSPPLPQPLGAPDDASYTTDGTAIVANSEDGQRAMAVNRLTGAVLWQIGTYHSRGNNLTHFNNPNDAVPAADGTVWMADIRNCRLVHLNGATGAVLAVLGGHGCAHNPPKQFSEPNGGFPTRDGSLVVTEISGTRVTWLNADGTVRWSHRVPAAYPSDGMAYPDGSVLLTDYSSVGAVLRIAADGAVMWRYSPRGAAQLNHPSIAIPLASNRIAICDDFNNRIVIVDPTTSTIVWQWSGNAAYRLLRPDGLDYRPS